MNCATKYNYTGNESPESKLPLCRPSVVGIGPWPGLYSGRCVSVLSINYSDKLSLAHLVEKPLLRRVRGDYDPLRPELLGKRR
jgi:hypothetical protein